MSSFPASNLLAQGLFVASVATVLAGALIAVSSERVIRSVCGLAIACFGLAGLYYFLNSPFLALMEILIYVGAICVTIVFAIMLAEPDEAPPTGSRVARGLWAALAVGISGAIAAGLILLGTKSAWLTPGERTSDGSVFSIGISLLTTYSMAFELISVALVIAIIGALVVARTGRNKDE